MKRIIESTGGIVVCGGKSTRMGQPKLSLPFGPETMLQRTVRILREVVAPVVVVAAEGQQLPTLPGDVLIARDEQPHLGPLGGLAVGLGALRRHVGAAYATGCDVPLLKPDFVRRIAESLGEADLVIPRDGDFHHPLAAVYRTSLEETARRLIDEQRLRPFFLLGECAARVIDVDELRGVDPNLDSLRNTNTPEEYRAALEIGGFAAEN